MEHRREIDGLRALAVLPVLFFHAGLPAFSGGFIGVDVFFVISGYLITSIILAEMQVGTFSLANFYERRARRILPALFVVMSACLPFAWLWLLPEDMEHFSQSLAAIPLFASNILFWKTSGYFDTAAELKPLLHTWSLSVEEQYYLLFPLFLILTWRLGKRWILSMLAVVGIASLTSAQWGSANKPITTFYLLPTRGWELLIGAYISFYFGNKTYPSHSQAGSLLGFWLITYSIFAFDKHTPFPSLYALIPTIGAGLIIVFATPQTLVGKLLGSKLFVGLGLISYSTYLWHQPLFAFARHRSLNEPSKLVLLALTLTAIVLGYFSWKHIEVPFRNNHRFSRNHILTFSVIWSALFVALGWSGYISKGFIDRLDADAALILAPASSLTSQNGGCHRGGSSYIEIESSCVLGDKNQIVGILIGDSHANALSHELDIGMGKLNLGLLQMTFNGCPPIERVYRVDMDADDKCSEFNTKAATYIKTNEQLEYVVIASRWTRYIKTSGFDNGEGGVERTNDFVDSIESGIRERNTETVRVEKLKNKYIATILSYLDAGKKVILIYPIPEVGWTAPSYLAKQRLFNVSDFNRSTSYLAFRDRNQEAIVALDSVGKHSNLTRIFPEKALCDSHLIDRCIFELNRHSLYYDHNHLSNAGARLIVDETIQHIRKQY